MRPLLPSLLAATLMSSACGGSAAVATPDGAVTPTARGDALHFAAGGPWRYEFQSYDTLITTLPNGQLQQQRVERRIQFQWSTVESGTGLALTVRIDSVSIVGVGRAAEDSARGAVIQATIDRAGHLGEVTSTSTSALVGSFAAQLRWLVPGLPGPGGVVEDTLDATVRYSVVDLTERTVRRSVSSTTDGAVELSGTVTRDGMTPQLRLTGSGSRAGRATLTSRGQLRMASGRDSVAMVATVESMGQSVRVLQVGSYTLTLLP